MASKTDRIDDSREANSDDRLNYIDEVSDVERENIVFEDFEDDLQRFIATKNVENAEPDVWLHKYEKNDPPSAKPWLCGHWKSHIPNEEEIGLENGSGRYRLILIIPAKGKQIKSSTTRFIRIGERYDELRAQRITKERQAQALSPAYSPYLLPPQSQRPPEDTAKLAFDMMQKMITLFIPLISQGKNSGDGGSIIQNYAAMNKILQAQTLDNLDVMKSMQRKILELPVDGTGGEEEMEPEKPKGIVDSFLSLLSNPAILGVVNMLTGHGPQAVTAAAIAKSIPEVKQVVADPVRVKMAVQVLDQKFGPEGTNAILKNLKVSLPQGTPRYRVVKPLKKGPINGHSVNSSSENSAPSNSKPSINA